MGRYGCNDAGFGNNSSWSMATTDEVLAGSYHVAKRRKEVLDRLRLCIEEIERSDIPKELEGFRSSVGSYLTSGFGQKKSLQEDVVVMQLRKLEDDIRVLEEDVKEYKGPHFTRAYRTAQGFCAKLQTELDALDVTGREDIRKNRKEALMRIDSLSKTLARQAHADGKSCDQCEVQD